jgi:hypothetical protein
VALVYLCILVVRILGAAYGPVRPAPALLAIVLVVASPWAVGLLNLDTRLWVAEDSTASDGADDADDAEALFYDQPARIAAAASRVKPAQTGRPGV